MRKAFEKIKLYGLKYFLLGIYTLVLLFPCAPSIATEEEDHNQLRQVRAMFEQAVNSNQIASMRPVLADEFRILTYTGREFRDFPTFITQWETTRNALLGENGRYKVNLNPELSWLFGDTAIAFGNAINQIVDRNGQAYEFNSPWTAIFGKQKGKWRAIQVHFSIAPDSPLVTREVQYRVQRLIIMVGLGSLVVGILVTWLFMRWKNRTRTG